MKAAVDGDGRNMQRTEYRVTYVWREEKNGGRDRLDEEGGEWRDEQLRVSRQSGCKIAGVSRDSVNRGRVTCHRERVVGGEIGTNRDSMMTIRFIYPTVRINFRTKRM